MLGAYHGDLVGKWCFISMASFFHTLDSNPNPNPCGIFLCPKFSSRPIGSFNIGVSLVMVRSVKLL
jgi:hypothetical protein